MAWGKGTKTLEQEVQDQDAVMQRAEERTREQRIRKNKMELSQGIQDKYQKRGLVPGDVFRARIRDSSVGIDRIIWVRTEMSTDEVLMLECNSEGSVMVEPDF